MRKSMVIKYISVLLLAILSAAITSKLHAAKTIEETKVIKESFKVDENTIFSLKNKWGDIKFVDSPGDELVVELTLHVKGKDPNEVQKLLDNYKLKTEKSSELIKVTNNNISKWKHFNILFYSKSEIVLDDGTRVRGIKDIQTDMKVFLPRIKKCKVETKYNNVAFDKINCTFDAEIYSGKLHGGDIVGDFILNADYSEITIGETQNSKLDIYDSEFEGTNMNALELNAKYSKISIGNTSTINMSSHDDKIKLGNIEGTIECEAKYSKLDFGDFRKAEFDTHDTELDGMSGDTLILDSKYNDMSFKDVGMAIIDLHDNKVNFESLKSLKSKESKYSKIKIEQGLTSLDVRDSHDDEYIVSDAGDGFEGINFKGKYSTLKFPISSNSAYHLNAEIKYGSIRYANKLNYVRHIKEDSKEEIVAFSNDGTKSSPAVNVKAHDCKIVLSDSVFD